MRDSTQNFSPKLVKTDNEITSSKISIFNKIWTGSVFWHEQWICINRIENFEKFPILPNFLIFHEKMTLREIMEQKFQIGTNNSDLIICKIIKYHYLPLQCKSIGVFVDFPSLYINDLVLPMIFSKNQKIIA